MKTKLTPKEKAEFHRLVVKEAIEDSLTPAEHLRLDALQKKRRQPLPPEQRRAIRNARRRGARLLAKLQKYVHPIFHRPAFVRVIAWWWCAPKTKKELFASMPSDVKARLSKPRKA